MTQLVELINLLKCSNKIWAKLVIIFILKFDSLTCKLIKLIKFPCTLIVELISLVKFNNKDWTRLIIIIIIISMKFDDCTQ